MLDDANLSQSPISGKATSETAPLEFQKKTPASLADNYEKNSHHAFQNQTRPSRSEMAQLLKPYIMHPEAVHLFYNSMILMAASKGLAVANPYILKTMIDSITNDGSLDFFSASVSVGLFGGSRLLSTVLTEYRKIHFAEYT